MDMMAPMKSFSLVKEFQNYIYDKDGERDKTTFQFHI
jgi:hypothetical protein